MTDSKLTNDETAEFLFEQIRTVAAKRKSFNLSAAEFNAMNHDGQIDHMNVLVFPAYEAAGNPAPRTEACLTFTSTYFK